MKPPPPMPATYGSVTPSVAAAATAASTASPPRRRTSTADRVASGSTVAAAPPLPIATACLAGGCGDIGFAEANGALPATDADKTRASVTRVSLPTTTRLAAAALRETSVVDVFENQAVNHAVDPLAVAVVRLAAYTFLDPARPSGVAHRALVEAVDLELQPVVAEVEEVALEEPRRLVGKAPAAEARVHRERPEVRDPAALVGDLQAHQACRFSIQLDHEAAELLRLSLRALDLFQQTRAVARANRGQVRLDVLVGHELEQEVDVSRLGAPDRDVHGDGAATGSRRGNLTAPDPSATPPRINVIPASSCQVSGSPSSSTPYISPVIVNRHVTRLTRPA